jgi:hypothetical protein
MKMMRILALDVDMMKRLVYAGLDCSDATLEWWHSSAKGLYGLVFKGVKNPGDGELIPAYTLEDIMERLPRSVEDRYQLLVCRADDKWCVQYTLIAYNCVEVKIAKYGITLLGAACQMLLWCIENGYVKTDKNGED